ncbi:MAG: type II toxin-antitoxin system VapC family toxin [Ktedonobacteraceae bacterium]
MPDLNDLPKRTRVFVDTNIFDYALSGKSRTCASFLERVALREVTAYVNTQVISDLIHKLMIKEAFKKQLISKATAVKLKECFKQDRAKAAQLIEYQQHIEKLLSIGLRVVPITMKLLIETKLERANYALLTGDSIHLGTMHRCQMNRRNAPLYDIVTHDGDFALIAGVTIWQPQDVIH